MGSITFTDQADTPELVLVGKHRGRDLVMLGIAQGEEGWAAGCALVDVLAEAGGLDHATGVVIDSLNAQVRVVKQVVRRG